MSPDTLFTVGIVVFSSLCVGLYLTYKEFSSGEPSRQGDTGTLKPTQIESHHN